ncbi:pimeloyl-ACP methyl ester carboxylesterase [Prauserella sediminis]|uniref:Pimeloyl-ACP methyl ester carboxylesterase n=1 Tax=Prauserella sediminis TaxID=577680 RepID=A0A839XNQ0_9PSEU|nr:alpha/beta hydrolase [Prauserella sediminis]MBB3662323.1 pimeloyl-ACP methyl ester carboxylesterase [Prauserella sediminis]
MRTEVTGADGVRIGAIVDGAAADTAGAAGADGGPPVIVFVHGWAQSADAWQLQLSDPRLAGEFRMVAMDLRGHGRSDVPDDGYDDPRVWADDLAAVLDLAGRPAVVVGWSYGGLVITDYLRVHGTAGLAGIVYAGAITELGRGHPGGAVGWAMREALPDALSADVDLARPAVQRLCGGMTAGSDGESLVDGILAVPPHVRAGLFRRDIGSADVLEAVDVPALVLHGERDAVVDITAAEYAAGKIPGARRRWLPGVGHLPFAEDAQTFGEELVAFARDAYRKVNR